LYSRPYPFPFPLPLSLPPPQSYDGLPSPLALRASSLSPFFLHLYHFSQGLPMAPNEPLAQLWRGMGHTLVGDVSPGSLASAWIQLASSIAEVLIQIVWRRHQAWMGMGCRMPFTGWPLEGARLELGGSLPRWSLDGAWMEFGWSLEEARLEKGPSSEGLGLEELGWCHSRPHPAVPCLS
jgi:hypothetical protein